MLDWIDDNWHWLHWVVWVAAVLFILGACPLSHAECLRSAQAVWDAHGGAHATWSMRHGEKCWYARTERKVMPLATAFTKHDTRAGAAGEIIPLPRPAMRNHNVGYVTLSPPTPRGLIAAEHGQFKTWSTETAAASQDLIVLQDRMVSTGWRLWLLASVERARTLQERLPPSR